MAATLEERVAVLEREVTGLKSRVSSTEPRIDAVEADMTTIPELIRIESRLMDSRFSRMQAEMDGFRKEMRGEMSGFRAEMNDRFDAVIRAISEIVAERPRKS
jgi:hypothetical protein